jgi:hypothetical protein
LPSTGIQKVEEFDFEKQFPFKKNPPEINASLKDKSEPL